MRLIKDISKINKKDLETINNCLIKFDSFLQQTTKQPTDENVALYEHWIDCMCDIQNVIIEEK